MATTERAVATAIPSREPQNTQAQHCSRVTQITPAGIAVLDSLPPAEVAELRRLNQLATAKGQVCR